MNSNNPIHLNEQLRQLIEWLNVIVLGGENDGFWHEGVFKPSNEKSFADRFGALQAMVNGRVAYETKAQLDAAGAPPSDKPLADVWNDPVKNNNGLYGWDGVGWSKSKFDVLAVLEPELQSNATAIASALPNVGISDRERHEFDAHPIPLVVDEAGNAVIAIERETGKLIVDLDEKSSGRVLSALGVENTTLPDEFDVAFLLADEQGRVALRVGLDGSLYFSESAIQSSVVRHYFIRGQSLSMGYKSQPALTKNADISALSFGYRPDSPDFSDLSPLIEVDAGVYGETPSAGAAGFYRRAAVGVYRDTDLSKGYPAALMSIHSAPGVNIEYLSKGKPTYLSTQEGAKAAKSLVEQMGLTYQVGAIFWVQGEANERDRTSPEDYAVLLETLIDDHNTDMRKALENPRVTLPLITYQTNHRYQYTYPLTALGQLTAAIRHPLIFMSGPIYQYDVVDHTHLDNKSSRRLGEKMMQAALAVENDGDWQPLRPIRIIQTGEREITAEFLVRYPPLVLDESEVVNPGDFGFEVLDNNGDPLAISSVTLGVGNTVRLTTEQPLPAVTRLAYAYHNQPGAASGRLTGARGNLRDSDPTLSVYADESGQHYAQYNYCVTFKEDVQA